MKNLNKRYLFVFIPVIIIGCYFSSSSMKDGHLYAKSIFILGLIVYLIWIILDRKKED